MTEEGGDPNETEIIIDEDGILRLWIRDRHQSTGGRDHLRTQGHLPHIGVDHLIVESRILYHELVEIIEVMDTVEMVEIEEIVGTESITKLVDGTELMDGMSGGIGAMKEKTIVCRDGTSLLRRR
jgi:hypothetical protein